REAIASGTDHTTSELKRSLRSCAGAFLGVALFSGVINVLMLTGSLFMLEIYDRVLPSRSVPTLIWMSVLAAALYLAQAAVDAIRRTSHGGARRAVVRRHRRRPVAALDPR